LVAALQNSQILPRQSDGPDLPKSGDGMDRAEMNGPETKQNSLHSPRPLRKLYADQPSPAPAAPSEGTAIYSPINWDALERLQRDLGEESGAFLDELIEHFLADTPAHMEKLESALTAADFSLLHRIAHSIKPSAKILGADLLSGMCGELEEATVHLYGQETVAVDHALTDGLRGHVEKILTEYALVHTALNAADFAKIAVA